ncbi:hypothetical protein E6C50_14475 [Flavobacterium supellecticarium]|uniref:Uncharacterized protein n=1 Tax=Flavobacterium supellecticarium TaxID=2565924 RepID=A0A4S3ZS85_9FLAO|nr:hypothetical protein [Flavobacterium supellecticarium]THF48485.1 hypothetical protein E6C50_14475 [Flavobacterium supellecticarium]
MPEYFDISLIAPKTKSSKSEIEFCLNELELSEGENTSEIFSGRQILVSIIDADESDFEELSIGLPEQFFYKDTFKEDLKKLTIFINRFFECNGSFNYALCSYELNGYLIGSIKKYEEFSNTDFLDRFPIVYERKSPLGLPLLKTNVDAQEILKQ